MNTYSKIGIVVMLSVCSYSSGAITTEVVNNSKGDLLSTNVEIFNTLDMNKQKPNICISGQAVLKPMYSKNDKLERVLSSKNKEVVIFTFKHATKSYSIVIATQQMDGRIDVDLNAGKNMNNALIKNGFGVSKDWEGIFVVSFENDVLMIESEEFTAEFKILKDGSYQYVKNTFKKMK